jgi:molybdopterin synthase catalytic subunit/molybdopterin synthase sulfur carrier subunit
MTTTILLFAGLSEAIGARSLTVAVEDDTTVAALLDTLGAAHPEIAQMRDRIAVAIDERYATPDTTVAPGATVALIPPVSGG